MFGMTLEIGQDAIPGHTKGCQAMVRASLVKIFIVQMIGPTNRDGG